MRPKRVSPTFVNFSFLATDITEDFSIRVRRSDMRSVPPRGSGWGRLPAGDFTMLDMPLCPIANLTPTRYREVVLTSCH